MNNLDIADMGADAFSAAYEKIKAAAPEKSPINSSTISLEDQINNFKNAAFSEQDDQALSEDLLSI
jgi:hypothetical protein